jgi:hypothetical protein
MMAGTLEVTEELCWMPAGWVFDTVLERMAAVLHTQEPALAERLLAARTEANGGYLDLRDLDLETLVLLFNAADSAYCHLKREGAQGFMAPEFYEGLLKQFQQLRDMLHAGRQARMRKRELQTPRTEHRREENGA